MASGKKYFIYLMAVIAALVFFLTIRIYRSSIRSNGIPSQDSSFVIRNISLNYYLESGFIPDSLFFDKGIVRPGDNLSKLLLPYGITPEQAGNIIIQTASAFNTNKLIAGKEYYVFYSKKDSFAAARYFVYEPNPFDFFILTLVDSINVLKGKKEVKKEMRYANGKISTSLWNVIIEQKLNPEIIFELSEVYAWVIDFYHLQKGDSFAVVYEENLVHDEPVGLGKIAASLFIHNGKYFYAFYFEKDGEGGYYDLEGKSLRKAFLKSPLKFSRITSGFTMSRFHPILKRFRPHQGIDYAAPRGTPVMTVGDGVISEAGYGAGNGNYVKVRHNNMYTTQYLHLSRFGRGIRKGAHVEQGDIIGYVGSTGLSTGPHLCFRFWKDNVQVNPAKIKTPPAEGIPPGNETQFDSLKKVMMEKLKRENTVSLIYPPAASSPQQALFFRKECYRQHRQWASQHDIACLFP